MRKMFSEKQIEKMAQDVIEDGEINIPLEKIVDKDGHQRFIEGDFTIPENLPSGIHLTYIKWSLSGSHLMLVIAGNVDNGTSWTSGASTTLVPNLPQWIIDKIYPVFATTAIALQTFNLYASDYSTQSIGLLLRKKDGKIEIVPATDYSITADRGFRFSYDLLIADFTDLLPSDQAIFIADGLLPSDVK